MTPKLTTGDTITNLKYYMFITNEYGKPSKGSIDLFIESFGAIILNGNLSQYMTDIYDVKLNHWWNEITLDLEEREIQSLAKYTGGFDWFKHIARAGKQLNSVEELREYILNETCDIEFKEYLINKNCNIQEENEIIASEIQDNTTYEISSTEIDSEINNIDITYKDSLKYRKNPLIIYSDTIKIELYHPTSDNLSIGYEYKVIQSDHIEFIDNTYTDINKLIHDLKIDDFYSFKYANGAPIIDLIK